MADNNLQFANCSRCQGWGVTQNGDSILECPDCKATGTTMQIDKYQVKAILPASFAPGEASRSLWWDKIKPYLFWVIVLATIALAVRLATSTVDIKKTPTNILEVRQETSKQPNLIARYTQPTGLLHFSFWLALLLLIYFIFLKQYDQKPPHNLYDLREEDADKQKHIHFEEDGSIDVIPYFTKAARIALNNALILTEKTKNNSLTAEIFLASLMCSGKTATIIARLEQDPEAACRYTISKTITKGNPSSKDRITISPEVRQIILEAFAEAYQANFDVVDIEDYLLSIAKNPGNLQSILEEQDLNYDKIKSVAFWLNEEMESLRRWLFWRERGRTRSNGYMNRAWTALPTPFLDRYSRDFTKLAAIGHLPIVKVRDNEIDSAIRILAGGERNNVLIVGEPGVGKTSIVGAIAARMVEEKVPEPLKDKRLIELDLSALVSGGKSAESNMEQILSEVKNAGNVILFIGHVETLVNKQGGLSAASLLEAASKSGQLQIIGTATFADYHRHIEANPTFANSFQKVEINEVNDEDAITIIEEESIKIQGKYKVLLTYPAIKAAVTLSRRLIPDQMLPEKAIDVLSDAAQLASQNKQNKVTKELVQTVLSRRSNVPVNDLTADESQKLMDLDEEMKKRVIGQDEAVNKITEALRRARTGLKDEKRPIGSFLFVGPTGVGKTETARTLAGTYFGNRDAMIIVDLSEYQDAKAIYRLIGAPASSAGDFTEGGALTRAVREKPYSILLLDEIEKAHTDVLNIFLQLLDDGRLTENSGRTVSFANTIVIATSNAGAQDIVKMVQDKLPQDQMAKKVQGLLQESFKPEFLNRFDAVVTFSPLSSEHVQTIATIMLGEVAKKLKEKDIEAVFANDVVAYVSKAGFDQKYGARPLRRAIQDNVETKLADLILTNKIDKKQKLVITAEMLGLT